MGSGIWDFLPSAHATAGKVLLSKVRIPKTKEFAKSLILTKEDYRLMKLYNYMVVV